MPPRWWTYKHKRKYFPPDPSLGYLFSYLSYTIDMTRSFNLKHQIHIFGNVKYVLTGTAFISSDKLQLSRQIHFHCLAKYGVQLEKDSNIIKFQPKDFDVILEDKENPNAFDPQVIKDYLELKMGATLRELGFNMEIPMMEGLSMINGALACEQQCITMATDVNVDNQIWNWNRHDSITIFVEHSFSNNLVSLIYFEEIGVGVDIKLKSPLEHS